MWLIHDSKDNFRVGSVDSSDVSPELCKDCIAGSTLSDDSSICLTISRIFLDTIILPTESGVIVNVDQAITTSVQARSDKAVLC